MRSSAAQQRDRVAPRDGVAVHGGVDEQRQHLGDQAIVQVGGLFVPGDQARQCAQLVRRHPLGALLLLRQRVDAEVARRFV
jgi:hypothetical protein